ncbi:MAG: hypothetical protein HW380_1795 [Magnetococcales bacterium]|nr:hypothetical protein [Magnetococcales bacterium]
MRASGADGYLERVARYVDGVLSQMAGHFGNQPSHRLAIMAAMQIADSLFQEMERKGTGGVGDVETRNVEELLTRLIAESDSLLGKS